jgi:hypothetical protein
VIGRTVVFGHHESGQTNGRHVSPFKPQPSGANGHLTFNAQSINRPDVHSNAPDAEPRRVHSIPVRVQRCFFVDRTRHVTSDWTRLGVQSTPHVSACENPANVNVRQPRPDAAPVRLVTR